MRYLVRLMFAVAAIIHLLPVSGVLGIERLAVLYGLSFDDANLAILMRHRSVLFGMLGLFLLYAAFKPSAQVPALIGGLLSTVSFLYLASAVGSYNAQIERVVVADVIALVCLIIAASGLIFQRMRS